MSLCQLFVILFVCRLMEKQVKEKQCEHSRKILELQNRLKEVQFEVNFYS